MSLRSFVRVGLLVAITTAAAIPHVHAAEKWTRVVSDHFETVGNGQDYVVRKVAQTLEHFHEVLVETVLAGAGGSPSRTVVLVFKDDLSFDPYKPQGAGKGAIGALFYYGDPDALIALNAENLDFGLQLVMNAYSQALVANAIGQAPPWLSNGLGEVYRTFQESDGGKGAIIGSPDRDRVETLRSSTRIPLRTLIELQPNSEAMTPGLPLRGIIDAQSWALVHYLSFGDRAPQLSRYLMELRSGADPTSAFTAAFGDLGTLEQEVNAYVRKFTFPAMRIVFQEKVKPRLPPRGQLLNPGDAESYVASLVARSLGVEQGRIRLERALKAAPDSARAMAVLGLLEIDATNPARGLELLDRAADLAPTDGWVVARLGRVLARAAFQSRSSPLSDLERARTVLRKAVELNAADFSALADLGALLLLNPDEPDEAIPLLSQAATLAPRRDEYRLWLSDALLRARRYEDARRQLGPLVARGRTPEIRSDARRLLASVGERQQRDAAPASSSNPLQAQVPASAPIPASRGAASPDTASGPGPVGVPALRRPQPDETRVFGMFTALECGPGGHRLVIETDSGLLKLKTGPPDVQFLTYRADAPATVSCGAITPHQRVLATYRADASPDKDAAGTAVAIELLPDDYAPPK